uniref:Uncharacterized protein n=1 Tax=Meloidogyne incognita TaxID=6306 RepID=A0A914NJM0_MELIC
MPAYNDEIFNTNIEQNVVPKLAVFEANSPPVAPQIKKSRKMDSQKFRSELIKNIDTFIFDADGVLWLGEMQFLGLRLSLNTLQSWGKELLF